MIEPRQSGEVAVLAFESLRLPQEAVRLRIDDARLDSVLRKSLEDASCAGDKGLELYAGSRDGRTQLLAPCLPQTIGLPIRLGEKVLWTLRLPAIRLTPAAQDGVSSSQDAVALLRWLRQHAPDRVIALTDVATSSPLHGALAQAAEHGYRLTRGEADTHLFHRFGESYAEFFDKRSSKYKNQLRKKEKVFVERFGADFELREYRRPDEVPALLAAARAINRKTYQYRLFGEAVDDDAASIAAGRRAAEIGALRSFVLWHKELPLAFVLGHQRSDGTFEHRLTGYDPDWRDFSPGIFCNILLLQRLYAEDRPRVLDFGSGDSDYKRLFSNESRMTANPLLIPRRLRYWLAFHLFSGAAAANALGVRLLERWGIKDQVKRLLRRAA